MRERNNGYLFVTSFNDEAKEHFVHHFIELENDPSVEIITVYISSYGGEVYNLIGMRDMIKNSSKPVATIAIGKAMSCGAALLAAGTKGLRFAGSDTEILVHEVSTGMAYDRSSSLKEKAFDVDRLNEKMLKNIAIDSGTPLSHIKSQIDKFKTGDWFMSAHEAKHLGIIDEIDIPRVGMMPAKLTIITNKMPEESEKKSVKPKTKKRGKK